MKTSSIVILAAVPALFACKFQSGFPAYVKDKQLYADNDFRGKAFKDLEFGTAVHGSIPTKAELKGKVLLIDFWATWCGPCRAVIPEMNEWKKKFGKDLVIVGVSDEATSKLKAFMQETPMDYIVASDPSRTMSKKLGVKGIPHVLVISKDGVVRYQGFPSQTEDPLTTEKLGQIVQANRTLK